MRTFGNAPSKVRKVTIDDSQTALSIYLDPSQPQPVVARTLDAPVADAHAGVSRKKRPSKKRKVVGTEDAIALTPCDEPVPESTMAMADRKCGPWTLCIRYALALVVITIVELTIGQMNKVSKLGFGGIMKFNLEGMERRDFLCFLMDRIDPVEMVIHISGGRSIPITTHTVKCILGSPCGGRDAPMVT